MNELSDIVAYNITHNFEKILYDYDFTQYCEELNHILLCNLIEPLLKSMEDIPPEYNHIVNNNFFDLLD